MYSISTIPAVPGAGYIVMIDDRYRMLPLITWPSQPQYSFNFVTITICDPSDIHSISVWIRFDFDFKTFQLWFQNFLTSNYKKFFRLFKLTSLTFHRCFFENCLIEVLPNTYPKTSTIVFLVRGQSPTRRIVSWCRFWCKLPSFSIFQACFASAIRSPGFGLIILRLSRSRRQPPPAHPG